MVPVWYGSVDREIGKRLRLLYIFGPHGRNKTSGWALTGTASFDDKKSMFQYFVEGVDLGQSELRFIAPV